MDYKNLIKEFCFNLGLDTVGFTKCRKFVELEHIFNKRKILNIENEFEEKNINKRINPKTYMEEGETIISIAFPYLYKKNKKQSINKNIYFSKYTYGMDYHFVVKNYLNQVCTFIESVGGKAIAFVDSNALPERHIAYLAGVGFIGKNNMIITEKYGSYVFLGEIITNLKIKEDNPLENKCGNCILCLEKCPTKAINNFKNNPNICMSYITQKKEIKDAFFSKFQGRLFGCDTCQDVCPYNRKVKLSKLKEFAPFYFMSNPSLEEILNINNSTFKDNYKRTSCGWRGKNIIKRNALINYFYFGFDNIDIKESNSPYLNHYQHRLFNKFKL